MSAPLANTLFVGKVYHRFKEIPSTNDAAAALLGASGGGQATAKSTPPEGTVVRADSQSAGRGQFGSHWETMAGENLTLSILLYPNWLEINAQFYLSMTIALAVLDTARQHLEERSIGLASTKWPNDLYIGDRKSGGILIQNTLSGAQWSAAVVGIGLNVNQLHFPATVLRPTSLSLVTGRAFDLDAVADRLFENVEQRYLQLKAGKRAEIRAEYEHNLYRRGRRSDFQRADGEPFSGTIRGVEADGRLRIETEYGVELFDLKEVAFSRPVH